jgi:hypothetical protein
VTYLAAGSVAFMSLFHEPQVVLFSENVTRAAGFYEKLGFMETFRVPNVGEPIHVDLSLDGYKIGVASVASTWDDHGLDPVRQPDPDRPTIGRLSHMRARAFGRQSGSIARATSLRSLSSW